MSLTAFNRMRRIESMTAENILKKQKNEETKPKTKSKVTVSSKKKE